MSDATQTSPQTPLPRGVKPSIVPSGNGAASKRWDTIQLAIRLGCVVLLTGAVVGFFCLSGKAITIEQVVLIVVAGGALAGISVTKPGGGTGATLIGGSLMLLTLTACGCGLGAIVPDPHPGTGPEPCAVERALVEGLDDAVGAVDAVLPDDAPKAAEGLSYARGGVEEGLAAVAACEALTAEGRSGLSAILPWITVAGHIVRGLMAILGAAHVHIPDALLDILHSLGLASAAPPIEREPPYQVAYFD